MASTGVEDGLLIAVGINHSQEMYLQELHKETVCHNI